MAPNPCHCGVSKYASFGHPGMPKTHCKQCRLDGMQSRLQRRCQQCLKTKAKYGVQGGTATHCAKCKLQDMSCLYGVCCVCRKTAAWYGINGKQTHCGKCRSQQMSPAVPSRRKCTCGKARALYAVKGTKAKYCYECKQPGMTDVVTGSMCRGCGLFYGQKGHDMLCSYCRPSKACGNKEQIVLQHLQTALHPTCVVHDKVVQSGCSRRRPDILIDANTHMVVVEVDEDQHRTYPEECEVTRMHQIAQDCGMPTVFIRYNPDACVHAVASSSSIRLQSLTEHVQRALAMPPASNWYVDAVYLYYDSKAHGDRQSVVMQT